MLYCSLNISLVVTLLFPGVRTTFTTYQHTPYEKQSLSMYLFLSQQPPPEASLALLFLQNKTSLGGTRFSYLPCFPCCMFGMPESLDLRNRLTFSASWGWMVWPAPQSFLSPAGGGRRKAAAMPVCSVGEEFSGFLVTVL